MLTRRRLVILLLLAYLGLWLLLILLERRYSDDGENYSLIEDGLYMGGSVARPPRGTRAVVNLCRKDDPYRCDSHLWEPIRDTEPAPTIEWLRTMVEWIEQKRRMGMTVYVHCRNGASRSGMLVVAYIMYKKNWPRDQSIAFVRSKREQTRPNPAFMERLAEWEAVLRSRQDAP